jgi:hypothetical protein
MRYAAVPEQARRASSTIILVDPSRVPLVWPEPKDFPLNESLQLQCRGRDLQGARRGTTSSWATTATIREDSRYWGFVPDENIVGTAFFVWMNFGDLEADWRLQLSTSDAFRKGTQDASSLVRPRATRYHACSGC